MEKINEHIRIGKYSEWHDVECIKDYEVNRKNTKMTYKSGTQYEASKINDNWWLIDQIGIKDADFKKYFKDI